MMIKDDIKDRLLTFDFLKLLLEAIELAPILFSLPFLSITPFISFELFTLEFILNDFFFFMIRL